MIYFNIRIKRNIIYIPIVLWLRAMEWAIDEVGIMRGCFLSCRGFPANNVRVLARSLGGNGMAFPFSTINNLYLINVYTIAN